MISPMHFFVTYRPSKDTCAFTLPVETGVTVPHGEGFIATLALERVRRKESASLAKLARQPKKHVSKVG